MAKEVKRIQEIRTFINDLTLAKLSNEVKDNALNKDDKVVECLVRIGSHFINEDLKLNPKKLFYVYRMLKNCHGYKAYDFLKLRKHFATCHIILSYENIESTGDKLDTIEELVSKFSYNSVFTDLDDKEKDFINHHLLTYHNSSDVTELNSLFNKNVNRKRRRNYFLKKKKAEQQKEVTEIKE